MNPFTNIKCDDANNCSNRISMNAQNNVCPTFGSNEQPFSFGNNFNIITYN